MTTYYDDPPEEPLTEREWQIACLLFWLDRRGIARLLGISRRTVHNYAGNIHRKWKVKDDTQIVMKAARLVAERKGKRHDH